MGQADKHATGTTLNLRTRRRIMDTITAYGFLSPWFIGFLFFSGIPIIASFVLSFFKWDMVNPPSFAGLQNYRYMFSQASGFWHSLWVTLVYTVLSVVVMVIWSLVMALVLNQRLRPKPLFQFLFFIPSVLPSVAMAFVFQLIFNQQIGIFNYLLSLVGISQGPNWLMNQKLIIPVLVFISIYSYSTGQMMLIFDASLKEVPRDLYEAADLDGAGFFRKFFNVTLPSISPVLLFNVVVGTIGSINGSFSIIYPLTQGGPGDASNVLSVAIYTAAFQNFQMGYASALSTVLFIIVAIISYFQFRLSRTWVMYET